MGARFRRIGGVHLGIVMMPWYMLLSGRRDWCRGGDARGGDAGLGGMDERGSTFMLGTFFTCIWEQTERDAISEEYSGRRELNIPKTVVSNGSGGLGGRHEHQQVRLAGHEGWNTVFLWSSKRKNNNPKANWLSTIWKGRKHEILIIEISPLEKVNKKPHPQKRGSNRSASVHLRRTGLLTHHCATGYLPRTFVWGRRLFGWDGGMVDLPIYRAWLFPFFPGAEHRQTGISTLGMEP